MLAQVADVGKAGSPWLSVGDGFGLFLFEAFAANFHVVAHASLYVLTDLRLGRCFHPLISLRPVAGSIPLGQASPNLLDVLKVPAILSRSSGVIVLPLRSAIIKAVRCVFI